MLSLSSCGLRQRASIPGSEVIFEFTACGVVTNFTFTLFCFVLSYHWALPANNYRISISLCWKSPSGLEYLSDPYFLEKHLFRFHSSKTLLFGQFLLPFTKHSHSTHPRFLSKTKTGGTNICCYNPRLFQTAALISCISSLSHLLKAHFKPP